MKRFKNILYINNEEDNQSALPTAVALADQNQSRLTVLDVINEIPDLRGYGMSAKAMEEIRDATFDDYQRALQKTVEPFKDKVDIETQVIEGESFLTIIREVLKNNYDLVIKVAETEGGFVSQLFCSTGKHLLRKCPVPVWIIKPGSIKERRVILAAVDFDEPGKKSSNDDLNRQIIEMAISLAHREKAELHIIHAWQTVAKTLYSSKRSGLSKLDIENYADEIEASRQSHLHQLRLQAQAWVGVDVFRDVDPKFHAIQGEVKSVVEQQAKKLGADLIVMGTLSHTGIPGFFIGSTAEGILNRIGCSVLSVKPAGFISPVTLS